MLVPGMKVSLDLISANGYELGDLSYSRGYVSRKLKVFEVKEAQGKRKGQLYIEVPHPKSTHYHFRQYLRRKEDVK